MRPIDSLSSVRKERFSSNEAGFTIALPKATGGFDGTKGIQYSWRLNEGYFFVGIEDRQYEVENKDNFEKETAKVVDRIFNDIAGDLFSSKFDIVSVEKSFGQFSGHRGVDIRATLTNTLVFIRVFWDSGKAYKLAVLLTEKQKPFEAVAKNVFDTLVLIPKPDTAALIRAKVQANTPKQLPQTPVTPKLKSDAEDAGLKGKVKSILQENEYIKGEKAGSPKKKDLEQLYNELGNLTNSVFYDDTSGFPFEIVVYGYLDGHRVSRQSLIEYGNELRVPIPPGTTSSAVKLDKRFDYWFAYKYDSAGQLAEKVTYNSSGRIWTRFVYKRTNNSVEEILYDENGKLNSRSIITHDEKGNEIKRVDVDAPLAGSSEVYTYDYVEFDSTGNWTKRVISQTRTINGRSQDGWVIREERTITYY
jgi:hypothetical protein